MNAARRAALEQMIVYSFAFLAFLLVFGTCGYDTVPCWHRGGTVMRNIFDWPTCVEITRK